MALSVNFKNSLELIASKLTIRHILEYGPGISTRTMLGLYPDADILSIEHDEKYYNKWKEEFRSVSNLMLCWVRMRWKKKGEGYVTYPLERNMRGNPIKYDLIFIDGRERHSCIVISKYLVAENGVVVVHDSERKAYRGAFDLYKYCCDYKPAKGPWTSILSDDINVEEWI